MKKHISIILIFALLLVAVVFCVLWQKAVHDKSDIEALAQVNATEAYTHFIEYQKTGDDADYWGGVSAFYAFHEAYSLITAGTNKTANSIFCNEVYGSLLCSPEKSKVHISEITDVMKILSENVMDENGYLRMSELRNTLQE